MKQIYTFRRMLSAAVLFFMVSTFSWAIWFVEVDKIHYELDEYRKTAMVSGCGDYLINVRIPSTIRYEGTTYSVTSIENGAFWNHYSLTSVSIPEGVTSIGQIAFQGCSSLTSISIPESMANIGDRAFVDCSSLTSIKIPDNVTSIEGFTFQSCKSLTSVEIGSSVTSIGDGAFDQCSTLTSIKIPDNVTSIGKYAFQYCSSLTSVEIGRNVTSIGDHAFDGCGNIKEVKFASVESMCRISYYTNEYRQYTYNHPCQYGVENLYIGEELINSLVIPNDMTNIGDYTFYGCSCLTSVEIPESVTSIGYSAFYGCDNIKDVKFASVESMCRISYSNSDSHPCNNGSIENLYIGDKLYARDGKQNTSFTIPNSINSIGNYAFYGCRPFDVIEIPNSVTSIGDYAFSKCGYLLAVKIPNSVTSIGNYAFYSCVNMSGVNIPNSVTSIGNYAFGYCLKMHSVNIPESVKSIGNGAFRNCNIYTAICHAKNVPTLGTNVFDYHLASNQQAVLRVPATALEAYKKDELWTNYFNTILPIEENADGIDNIEANETNTPYYTLDGKQVDNPTQKGIYIKDGKKILIK